MRRKPARRVARDVRVVCVHQATHHGRIGVEQLGIYREVVVVDDRVDAFAERREAVDDDLPDALDVVFVAHGEAFEVDEETIRRLVIGEALFERDRQNVIAQFIGPSAKMRGSIRTGGFGMSG